MNSAIFYKEIRSKTDLQNQLDETLDNISRISFENEQTDRKNRLQEECNALRKALVGKYLTCFLSFLNVNRCRLKFSYHHATKISLIHAEIM